MYRQLLEAVALRCPGGKIPKDYIVFDTETSGFVPGKDYVCQYACSIVKEAKVAHSFASYIYRDLPMSPGAMAVHGLTPDFLKTNGVMPVDFIPGFVDIFRDWQKQGGMFMGHNSTFDCQFLTTESSEWDKFEFGENSILDTGFLVKSAYLGVVPRTDETLAQFYKRVRYIKSTQKWSLWDHCYAEYGLEKSGVLKDAAHDAQADCVVTHCLFEEIRARACV